MKGESDEEEEEAQSSQLYQIETEADGEDCEEPELGQELGSSCEDSSVPQTEDDDD